MNASVRTFISIHIPDTVRGDIGAMVDRLRPTAGADVKWVRPESLHLTLKFLGDLEEGRIAAVGTTVETAVSARPAFNVALGGTGAFPNPRRPSVLWIGVPLGAEPMAALAGEIESALAGLGFEREKRPFSAHLTIGRVRPAGNAGRTVERMEESGFKSDPFTVGAVHLMKSELQRSGAEYTVLRTIKLQG
jgi:RNA 2',3'-cyclic 3'-phosphodiesterase